MANKRVVYVTSARADWLSMVGHSNLADALILLELTLHTWIDKAWLAESLRPFGYPYLVLPASLSKQFTGALPTRDAYYRNGLHSSNCLCSPPRSSVT